MIRTGVAGPPTTVSGGASGGPVLQEGNYATLSETSDEMYAAIEEDNVYMDPAVDDGAGRRPPSRDEVDDPSLMYSKVDKNKKRTLRRNEGGASGYAMVNKPHSTSRLSAAPLIVDSQGPRPPSQQLPAAVAGGPWRSSDRNSSGSYYASTSVTATNESSAKQQEASGGGGGARPRLQLQQRYRYR